MASNYWLKLYHEMLDDPKVMTLRPALRWRFVETLLVAGELDEEGALPNTDNYAWRVRANVEIVETELAELADAGLLSRDDGRWLVTKFAERQSPDSSADRMRRMRERKRKQEYYQEETESLHEGDAPVTNRNTDKIREDKDEDRERARNEFELLRGYVAKATLKNPAQLDSGDERLVEGMFEVGYTFEQVQRHFIDEDGYWYLEDWRGKKGQTPTIKAINDTIGTAVAWGNGELPKPKPNGVDRDTLFENTVKPYATGRKGWGDLSSDEQKLIRKIGKPEDLKKLNDKTLRIRFYQAVPA